MNRSELNSLCVSLETLANNWSGDVSQGVKLICERILQEKPTISIEVTGEHWTNGMASTQRKTEYLLTIEDFCCCSWSIIQRGMWFRDSSENPVKWEVTEVDSHDKKAAEFILEQFGVTYSKPSIDDLSLDGLLKQVKLKDYYPKGKS